MLPDLNRVIEQVSKEKGIDRDIIVKALEEAMLSAAKRTFGLDRNIEAQFNPEIGQVELFEIKRVVETVQDADNEVTLDDIEEARELFTHMLSCRNSCGLLSEDIDPVTHELWGNFPQTYSMVGIIKVAARLSRSWEDAL